VPPLRLSPAPRSRDDRRQPAAGDALLVLAPEVSLPPTRRRPVATPREGEHREHAIFANDFCASAHPSDPAAALLALGATIRTDRRELPLAELYRLPTEDDRSTTTLAPDELIVELDVPRPDASVYLKAMDRRRWAFALVGVAGGALGDDVASASAGVRRSPGPSLDARRRYRALRTRRRSSTPS
jgi:xanthine dehydrogenase YagS FAD-binding subunit